MLDLLTIFVAVFVFVGFSSTSFVLLFFARKIHGRKFSISWIVLAIGNVLLGWSYLMILTTEEFVLNAFHVELIVAAMAFVIFGLFSVFREKSAEITSLRNRYNDLEESLDYLRTKFMKREISEEELKELHKDFMKEMAEIEVKLKRTGAASGKEGNETDESKKHADGT